VAESATRARVSEELESVRATAAEAAAAASASRAAQLAADEAAHAAGQAAGPAGEADDAILSSGAQHAPVEEPPAAAGASPGGGEPSRRRPANGRAARAVRDAQLLTAQVARTLAAVADRAALPLPPRATRA